MALKAYLVDVKDVRLWVSEGRVVGMDIGVKSRDGKEGMSMLQIGKIRNVLVNNIGVNIMSVQERLDGKVVRGERMEGLQVLSLTGG